MALTTEQLSRLSELLDTSLSMPPMQRRAWLDSLPEKDRPLVQALRESLLGDDPANASGWALDRMPGIETIAPPIDARRQSLTRYAAWKQKITVETMLPKNVQQTTTKGSQPVSRITVKITKNDREICRVAWLRTLPPKG